MVDSVHINTYSFNFLESFNQFIPKIGKLSYLSPSIGIS